MMTGKSISDYVAMGQSVVAFLERVRRTRIREAVFDFVVDYNNKAYLVNFRYY
jgi:hypothetical protein